MIDVISHFDYHGATLRKVSVTDIDFLVDFLNDAYSYQDEHKGEPRTNQEHLQKRVGETDFYVVELHGSIVGCFYLEAKPTGLHFGLFTVGKEHRGDGLAQEMYKAIEDYARKEHFKQIELDYMSVAPWLKDYYEKIGFEENGEVIKWGKIDLVHMVKKL